MVKLPRVMLTCHRYYATEGHLLKTPEKQKQKPNTITREKNQTN